MCFRFVQLIVNYHGNMLIIQIYFLIYFKLDNFCFYIRDLCLEHSIYFSFQGLACEDSVERSLVKVVMRDLSGLREHSENIARSLFVLTPPERLLGDLQRALRICYRVVNIAEHVSGYLNKSFNDGFGTVLQFANSGPREFFDSSTARRYRDIRKVVLLLINSFYYFMINFLSYLDYIK